MASSLADLEGGAINMAGIRYACAAALARSCRLRRNPLASYVPR